MTRRSIQRLLATLAFTAVAGAVAPAAQAADCADALFSDRRFSKFAELVQLSGLADRLRLQTVTIFAPTNEALNQVSAVTQMLASQSSMRAPDFAMLQTLVRVHVIQGRHPATEYAGKQTELTTQAGTILIVNGNGTPISVTNRAIPGVDLSGMRTMHTGKLIGAPIACENGAINPVDQALIQ